MIGRLLRGVVGAASRIGLIGNMQEFERQMDTMMARDADSGEKVTADLASRVAVVHACVKVLAEGVASLPFKVYRRRDGWREPAPEHPLNRVLSMQANDTQTAYDMLEERMGSLCLKGRAYAQVVRNGKDAVHSIVGLDADKMTMVRLGKDGKEDPEGEPHWVYKVNTPEQQLLAAKDLWRTQNFLGLSPIDYAANSIGLTRSMERSAGRLFKNGTLTGTVLEYPATFKDQAAADRLRKQWEEMHAGSGNHHKAVILEGGMKLAQQNLSPQAYQFIESRRFQKEEICSIFRVPPHMVADLQRATFSNIEEQGMDFVRHTLGAWLTRLEQSANRDLLLPEEQGEYEVRANVDALLRGNYQTRMSGHVQAVQNRIMTVNEVRRLESLPPRDDGDEFPQDQPTQTRPPGGGDPDGPEAPDDAGGAPELSDQAGA